MQFPTLPHTIRSKKSGQSYSLVRADLASFDAEAPKEITAICSQPEVYKLFEGIFKGRPYSEKDAQFFLSHVASGWKNGTNFHWMIFSGREVVGTVGIKSTDGEIGYWQSKDHPGVMSSAVEKLCDFAKSARMPSLWAYVRRDNAASIRVLERAGFELDQALTSKRDDAFGYRRSL